MARLPKSAVNQCKFTTWEAAYSAYEESFRTETLYRIPVPGFPFYPADPEAEDLRYCSPAISHKTILPPNPSSSNIQPSPRSPAAGMPNPFPSHKSPRLRKQPVVQVIEDSDSDNGVAPEYLSQPIVQGGNQKEKGRVAGEAGRAEKYPNIIVISSSDEEDDLVIEVTTKLSISKKGK